MNLYKYYKTNLSWVPSRTILFGRAGSHAYGLNTISSDEDFKGIAIPPKEYFFGFMNKFEQSELKKKKDSNIEFVIYNIMKFFSLCANNNPNMLEMLWLDPDDYLVLTKAGHKLIENRDLFLSKKAKFSFAGYAFSQMKRIKTHRDWLLHPKTKEPTRKDFGLPEYTLITRDQAGAFNELVNNNSLNEQDVSPNFLETLAKEKSYYKARTEWQHYNEWKKARNPERAKLEAQFGYDCKHASHLVRLLKMCEEILTLHKVIVRRENDRDELLAIKNGVYDYDKLMEWVNNQQKKIERLYEESTLQAHPSRKQLDKLCIEIVEASTLTG